MLDIQNIAADALKIASLYLAPGFFVANSTTKAYEGQAVNLTSIHRFHIFLLYVTDKPNKSSMRAYYCNVQSHQLLLTDPTMKKSSAAAADKAAANQR